MYLKEHQTMMLCLIRQKNALYDCVVLQLYLMLHYHDGLLDKALHRCVIYAILFVFPVCDREKTTFTKVENKYASEIKF